MKTASPPKPSSDDGPIRTPYLKRVEKALSRSLLKMEVYRDDTIHKSTSDRLKNGKEAEQRPRRPFYPHVELGTAPIEIEHIEDLQKIRPFGVKSSKNISPLNHPNNSAASGEYNKSKANNDETKQSEYADIRSKHDVKESSSFTPNSIKSTPSTARKRESCMIESTQNSVRVSFLFKAQAKAASEPSADPIEASILFQWMRCLMLQGNNTLLRKKPIDGYSVTFLITNKHLAIHGRQRIEDCILDFCTKIDKECSDIKLKVNAQARHVTTEFLKAFNKSSTEVEDWV